MVASSEFNHSEMVASSEFNHSKEYLGVQNTHYY